MHSLISSPLLNGRRGTILAPAAEADDAPASQGSPASATQAGRIRVKVHSFYIRSHCSQMSHPILAI